MAHIENMHDTRELVAQSRWSEVARTVLGTLLLVAVANVGAGWYMRHRPPTVSRVLVARKWAMLQEADPDVDWLILGDSTANQGVVPEILEEMLGIQARNYSTYGPLTVINSAWMLDERIRCHGPPQGVILVHAYDEWRRGFQTDLLGYFPQPWGFWRDMDPALDLDLGALTRLGVTTFLPLYSSHVSLSHLLTHPFRTWHREFPIQDDGFFPWPDSDVGALAEDVTNHRAWLSEGRDFTPSPDNLHALRHILELAETHQFDVYLANAPLYEGLFDLPGFAEYHRQMVEFLTEFAATSPRLHYLLRDPMCFVAGDLANADHVVESAARRFTRRVAGEIGAVWDAPHRDGEARGQ